MSNSFTKYHFNPSDIGRLNDYAIQAIQVHRVPIIIDPRWVLDVELTTVWVQWPLLRPARKPPSIDQMQHYIGKVGTKDTVPLA